MFVRFDEFHPTTVFDTSARIRSGSCSKFSPTSSAFNIKLGLSPWCSSSIMTFRSLKYLFRTSLFTILARNKAIFSGFLVTTSGCRFLNPSFVSFPWFRFWILCLSFYIMIQLVLRIVPSIFKGSITIRHPAIPSMVVNFSTFAFLLNFSFMK